MRCESYREPQETLARSLTNAGGDIHGHFQGGQPGVTYSGRVQIVPQAASHQHLSHDTPTVGVSRHPCKIRPTNTGCVLTGVSFPETLKDSQPVYLGAESDCAHEQEDVRMAQATQCRHLPRAFPCQVHHIYIRCVSYRETRSLTSARNSVKRSPPSAASSQNSFLTATSLPRHLAR
jgi:hypothetical protein